MEEFKVSLESLYSNKIKEIDYEGEEHYQERPSLSQRITELAQRVDFSEVAEGQDGEPAVKKATQKWPWEQVHSKLKQALTEVSVLADMLSIVHDHRHYMAMDQVVMPRPLPPLPLAFQYLVNKKALGVAADILQRGTKALSHSSSREEREFHRALADLRKRWRVRRAPNGAILGDLSYSTAGSLYLSHTSVIFEVRKALGLEGSSAPHAEGREILSITIPRELQGRSEIVVFLSTTPVKAVESIGDLGAIPQVPQRRSLPLWEMKLVAAQNTLFNQELFSQLAREAYDQKTELQYEVYTNRVIVPLRPSYWLSILLVREYEDEKPKLKPISPPKDLPPPRWDLVVAAKQLLRQKHQHNASLHPPRPTTAMFTDNVVLQNAGANALTESQIKEADYKDNIFGPFLEIAKHTYNEERLRQWLTELVGSNRGDPLLQLQWAPNLSMVETIASINLSSEDVSHTVQLQLNVDTIVVHQVEGASISFVAEKEKLLRILRHQIVVHQMLTVCQVAKKASWTVLQSFTRPLLSLTLAKGGGNYLEACNILLQSPDAHNKLDILLEWKQVSVSHTYSSGASDAQAMAVPHRKFKLDSNFGQSFFQRVSNMLSSMA